MSVLAVIMLALPVQALNNHVLVGYWHNFRFDPRRAEAGENPFQLDSKAPTADYQEFIKGEVRYTSLALKNPARAEQLFNKAEGIAKAKYEEYAAKAGK